MFLADIETKGNVLKLYFADCKDYHGAGWDKIPYEHNAGIVDDEYVTQTVCFAIPWDYDVVLAENDWHYQGGSPFCKNDFKNEKAPCVIICKDDIDVCYSKLMGDKHSVRLYYNTPLDKVVKALESIECTIM